MNGLLLQQRYEVTSLLGEGGFGKTYAGIDRETGTPIAIKTISLKQMQDWKSLDFFQREASILAQLDHPGIPKIIASFYEDTETDRTFYLVRELAVGESLANLIKQGWRAQEAEIRDITAQLLEILIYLHELSPPVIHRDIKPSNIIYQPDRGSVFLIDFGSVFLATGAVSGIGTFVGTYGYIAPEQLRGEVSAQSDIYSVAMTVAFLLTGREPSELPRKELRLNLRSLKVNASAHLLEWIDRANAPIPEERFTSAREALENLQSQLCQQVKPPMGSNISVTIDETGLTICIPCYLQNSWKMQQNIKIRNDDSSHPFSREIQIGLYILLIALSLHMVLIYAGALLMRSILFFIIDLIKAFLKGGTNIQLNKEQINEPEIPGYIQISTKNGLLKVVEVRKKAGLKGLFLRQQTPFKEILEVSLDQVVLRRETRYKNKLCKSITINQINRSGLEERLMQVVAISHILEEPIYVRRYNALLLRAAELKFLYTQLERHLEQHMQKSIKS